MTKSLTVQAFAKVTAGIIVMGVLLFVPAGTLHYPQGWLLMGILFIPMVVAGVVMMFKNPELLKKRLNAKEEQAEQNMVIKLSALMFVVGFVVAGLSYRFSWLMLPTWVSIAGAVLFLLSYLMYAEVLRENAFLSRTVEVQENQTVVDTGLYGIVRHPMYSATLLLFLSMPLVLGSALCFVLFLAYPVLIVKRIKNEEKVLAEGLQGYTEYLKKVKYRLIPYVW